MVKKKNKENMESKIRVDKWIIIQLKQRTCNNELNCKVFIFPVFMDQELLGKLHKVVTSMQYQN